MHLTQKYRFHHALLVCLSLLLSACGFHLRGDYDIPESLNRLSLTSYDQYSQFTRMVKNQLRMNEVQVVAPSANIPDLHLLSDTITSRTLSVYQNTRAAEEELTLTATYRVTIPNISDNTFTTSVTRSYLDNSLTALAKSVEKALIEKEMHRLAAQQIIRQMARLKSELIIPEETPKPRSSEKPTTIKITTTELKSKNSVTQ